MRKSMLTSKIIGKRAEGMTDNGTIIEGTICKVSPTTGEVFIETKHIFVVKSETVQFVEEDEEEVNIINSLSLSKIIGKRVKGMTPKGVIIEGYAYGYIPSATSSNEEILIETRHIYVLKNKAVQLIEE